MTTGPSEKLTPHRTAADPKNLLRPGLTRAFATAAILPLDLNTSSTINAERPRISVGTMNSSPKNIARSIRLRDLASGLNSDFAVTLRFGILRYLATVAARQRVLVVSQFPPSRPWSAGNAMARNNVTIGLSLALVVVEASEKGGTLSAGTKALQLNRPVLALEFATNPLGNAELIRRGAISIRHRAELRARLTELVKNPQGNQLSMSLPARRRRPRSPRFRRRAGRRCGARGVRT
jgi:DNA recombination-mediator protein A